MCVYILESYTSVSFWQVDKHKIKGKYDVIDLQKIYTYYKTVSL